MTLDTVMSKAKQKYRHVASGWGDTLSGSKHFF